MKGWDLASVESEEEYQEVLKQIIAGKLVTKSPHFLLFEQIDVLKQINDLNKLLNIKPNKYTNIYINKTVNKIIIAGLSLVAFFIMTGSFSQGKREASVFTRWILRDFSNIFFLFKLR